MAGFARRGGRGGLEAEEQGKARRENATIVGVDDLECAIINGRGTEGRGNE